PSAAACCNRTPALTGAQARPYQQQYEMNPTMQNPSDRSLTRRILGIIGSGLFAFVVMTASDAAGQSSVQGVPNAMQGFSQNRDQPIQIEAAALELRDKKKEATFSGNVKVVQGDTTMTSKTLVVYYEGGSSPADGKAK